MIEGKWMFGCCLEIQYNKKKLMIKKKIQGVLRPFLEVFVLSLSTIIAK